MYFVVYKIKIRTTNKLHTIESWEWRFKKIQHMVINGGRKSYSWNYFYKFIEQLEPKENFRINHLKWMTYKQEVEESLDDFVNRCRRMALWCSLTEHEQQQRIIELIIASTPNADFQMELLRKDKTLTLEETVCTGKTYETSNIHIKQLRAMVNNNNGDNTNIKAIRTPTSSNMSNNCLKCGKSHAFHGEACPASGSKCNTW